MVRLKITVYSATNRSIDDLTWCANANRIKALSWYDGYLFCYETKLLEKWKELFVSDVCVAKSPYKHAVEVKVEGMPASVIPVTKASSCEIEILKKGLDLLRKDGGKKDRERKRSKASFT